VPAQPQDYQQPGAGDTRYQQAAPQPQAAPAASSRRPKLLIALALGVVVVLVAAGGLIFVAVQRGGIPAGGIAAGTVQGRLVDKSAVAAAGNGLQLLTVTSQSGETLAVVVTDKKVTTDKNGRFTFDTVAAGKYMIIDNNVTISLNNVVAGNLPSWEQMLVLGTDGTALTFDMPASKGLDLGNVTMPASS
jgi:flagellar basal body-associated protein FliL